MKTLFLILLSGVLLGACNRDTQDMEREEEMNRGDLIEDALPDNLDSQPVEPDAGELQ